MYCARSELIELIEQVDQIHVDSHPIILELVSWLPGTTISTFIEDAKAALELGEGWQTNEDIEYPVQGPNWPSEYDEPEPPTELAEDHFVNEGIKAREAMKEKNLHLVQCSEV